MKIYQTAPFRYKKKPDLYLVPKARWLREVDGVLLCADLTPSTMLPTTPGDEVWLTSTALETAIPGLDDTPRVGRDTLALATFLRAPGTSLSELNEELRAVAVAPAAQRAALGVVTAFLSDCGSLWRQQQLWQQQQVPLAWLERIEPLLRALARHDRPSARAVATELDFGPVNPAHEAFALARALIQCPQAGDLEQLLDVLAVIPSSLSSSQTLPAPLTVAEALAARGRRWVFDAEVGSVPPPHGALLRRLSHVVGLDDVVFKAVPGLDDDRPQRPTTRLLALLDGACVEVPARGLGDVLDVESCVAFVNSLQERRGNPWRLVLAGEDGTDVIAAPQAALCELRARGLLLFGHYHAAPDTLSPTLDAFSGPLRRFIATEDPSHPLSDAELADRLHGLFTRWPARRTITKYRRKLGIPSARARHPA